MSSALFLLLKPLTFLFLIHLSIPSLIFSIKKFGHAHAPRAWGGGSRETWYEDISPQLTKANRAYKIDNLASGDKPETRKA